MNPPHDVVGTGVPDGPNTIEFNDYKMACFFKSIDNTDIILINVVARTVEDAGPYDNGCANIGFLGKA